MAGTLGLGYVVQLAQRWAPAGLSLGDLVYSLPLAPGEQQRVAVFEQRQALSTAELETLDFDEQQRQSQVSDSSTEAVFNSAFAEQRPRVEQFHDSCRLVVLGRRRRYRGCAWACADRGRRGRRGRLVELGRHVLELARRNAQLRLDRDLAGAQRDRAPGVG